MLNKNRITMQTTFLITYLHYLSFILVGAALFTELLLVKQQLNKVNLSRIVKADAVYGIFSIVLVTTGLIRVFYFGKGSDYYFSNWIFNLKFSLFILVGLLSILPTIQFLKSNKKYKNEPNETQIDLPNYTKIRISVILEFFILLLIPFLAILMANGVGA